MSSSLIKAMVDGFNFNINSPADCMYVIEQKKTLLDPKKFNPMIPLTGGWSFIGGGGEEGDSALISILVSGDWLFRCRDSGASSKNALICLASNFDEFPGVIAMTLEAAMIAMKEKTSADVRIKYEEWADIIEEIFLKDYAGILRWAGDWGCPLKAGSAQTFAEKASSKKTRQWWRRELSHDVLIDPRTLEPCKDKFGNFLWYDGVQTINDPKKPRTVFRFTSRRGPIETSWFPPDNRGSGK